MLNAELMLVDGWLGATDAPTRHEVRRHLGRRCGGHRRVVASSRDAASQGPTVVVVSAMSGMTDELLRTCQLARTGHVERIDARVSASRRGIVRRLRSCSGRRTGQASECSSDL